MVSIHSEFIKKTTCFGKPLLCQNTDRLTTQCVKMQRKCVTNLESNKRWDYQLWIVRLLLLLVYGSFFYSILVVVFAFYVSVHCRLVVSWPLGPCVCDILVLLPSFYMVSCIRYGTRLYRFLIFTLSLTFYLGDHLENRVFFLFFFFVFFFFWKSHQNETRLFTFEAILQS